MITCVQDGSGNYVHSYYHEIICWQGLHILYAIMAIIVSIVFILISLIVTFTFYETKSLTNNAGSRYF